MACFHREVCSSFFFFRIGLSHWRSQSQLHLQAAAFPMTQRCENPTSLSLHISKANTNRTRIVQDGWALELYHDCIMSHAMPCDSELQLSSSQLVTGRVDCAIASSNHFQSALICRNQVTYMYGSWLAPGFASLRTQLEHLDGDSFF